MSKSNKPVSFVSDDLNRDDFKRIRRDRTPSLIVYIPRHPSSLLYPILLVILLVYILWHRCQAFHSVNSQVLVRPCDPSRSQHFQRYRILRCGFFGGSTSLAGSTRLQSLQSKLRTTDGFASCQAMGRASSPNAFSNAYSVKSRPVSDQNSGKSFDSLAY